MDPMALRATMLLGGAALLLLALALLGSAWRSGLPVRQAGRIAVAVTWIAVGLAIVGGLGAALMNAALVRFGVSVGVILTALAAFLLAMDAPHNPVAVHWRLPWMMLGVLGLAATVAQTLAGAVDWMLPVYAALVMAVYGFAWVQFGNILYRHHAM